MVHAQQHLISELTGENTFHSASTCVPRQNPRSASPPAPASPDRSAALREPSLGPFLSARRRGSVERESSERIRESAFNLSDQPYDVASAEASMPDAQNSEAIWGGCPGEPTTARHRVARR